MVLPNARRSWIICDSSQPDGLGVFDALDETDYCLPAGGDMVCHTANPLRPVWRIGIEDPHHTTSLIAVVVPIRSGAVATSGRAHRGRHLVDPHTGQHPTGVASATVIADSLTWADIDATAAYVQGGHAVRWLRTRPIRSALIVWTDGTTARSLRSNQELTEHAATDKQVSKITARIPAATDRLVASAVTNARGATRPARMQGDRQHRQSRIPTFDRSVCSEETRRFSTGTITVGHCAWLRQ
jgi:hypothetical protein